MYRMIGIIGLVWLPQLFASSSEEVFTRIYKDKIWGEDADGEGSSGPGSSLEQTKVYREFLQRFIRDNDIRSVVDVGCGDWSFSRTMDWAGVQYTGYDVVKSVIEKNQERYGSDSIHFVHGDAVNIDLPKADLLICKEVLQHLPNEEIHKFLKQLPKFTFCVIVNGVDPETKTSSNPELIMGGYY